MLIRLTVLILFMLAVSVGCSAKYGCPAPDGVTCKSMTEVYHAAGEVGKSMGKEAPEKYIKPEVLAGPVPIRKAPKVIRIWLAPWVDEDEDLHQPGYIYAELQTRKWAMGEYPVEAAQRDALPMPPPAAQQRALNEMEKEREKLEKAKQPPTAPEGTPPLPGLLK